MPDVGVGLSHTGITLDEGESFTLTATVSPADAAVEWSSSNPSVATVSGSGLVTAVSAGSATITAVMESGGASASCAVTVVAAEGQDKVTGVSLSKSEITLKKGDRTTLTATVRPENTENRAVFWSSSDTSVASVSNGTVTANAKGSATITVTTAEGGFKATCKVTVTDDGITGVSISPKSLSLKVGEEAYLTATVSPQSAGVQTLSWSSSDSSVASIWVDNKGNYYVTAKSPGTTKITAAAPGGQVSGSCDVTVVAASSETSVQFNDVSSWAYYYQAVMWAVEEGITSGTGSATFSPDAACTRAQTVTFLWRNAGSPSPKSRTNPFRDISSSAWYYEAVLWAVEEGITSGTSDGTFSPDATVTRAQTVTFLYRASKSRSGSGESFSDVPSGAYYENAVRWAVRREITSGTSATEFSPNAVCTRGQIVTFLYRYASQSNAIYLDDKLKDSIIDISLDDALGNR